MLSLRAFQATIEGFAVASSLLAVSSAYVAWIAQRSNLTVPQIADAAGLGLAIAFVPSLIAGGYVYASVASSGLSLT